MEAIEVESQRYIGLIAEKLMGAVDARFIDVSAPSTGFRSWMLTLAADVEQFCTVDLWCEGGSLEMMIHGAARFSLDESDNSISLIQQIFEAAVNGTIELYVRSYGRGRSAHAIAIEGEQLEIDLPRLNLADGNVSVYKFFPYPKGL